MGLIGSQIIGDQLYPEFKTQQGTPNYHSPLQLLAKRLSFTNPITGEKHHFESAFKLKWQTAVSPAREQVYPARVADKEINVSENPNNAMLSDSQARVLGSLMEKQMTTPDYYPLTLNALVAACNQKSSRNPVMNLTPQQVGSIISELRHDGLITANTLTRTDRYEQFLSRKLKLSSKERAIICVMLLRGSHTLNEIKVNTNRMTEFSDHAEIEQTLQDLMDRDEPLVIRIPRAAGQREDRFTHLLCGTPAIEAQPTKSATSTPSPLPDDALARISRLEEIVTQLQTEIEQLKKK